MKREDYEKSLEGLSEEKKSELLSVFDEQSKSIEHLTSLKSEAFKERDEHKRKRKELEDEKAKAEADAKLKQGEFQSLYEEANKKVTEYEKQLAEVSPYKEKYEKVESDRRNELIAQIPEKETDIIDIAKKIGSLEDLKSYVKIAVEKLGKKTVDSGRGGNGVLNVEGKSWDDFSIAERQQLFIQNKPAYDKLKEKKYGNK